MLYALLPPSGGAPIPARSGEVQGEVQGDVPRCLPRQIRGGMDRFLDARGELRLFIPDCLALAAPFILFRLKREGFSRCYVQASKQGLYVEGRR